MNHSGALKHFSLTGVSFRTLGIEGREMLAGHGTTPGELARRIVDSGSATEAAVISTCNRFEVVTVGSEELVRPPSFFEELIGRPLPTETLYHYRDGSAVKHLYRVAASLDSMVVGEQQILGQVKDAYRQAVRSGSVGAYLHHLFQSAFSIAKRVRSNTGVSQYGVSVSYVAVRLAQQIFGDLASQTVLVIGSGQMAELAVLHLCTHGCRRIVVANRTLSRATELADRFGGSAVSLDDLSKVLSQADIVIGSIAAEKAVVDVSHIQKMKRSNPIFFIDLGVPRNFSPNLANLDSVYLYNIDDLSAIAEETRGLREEAMKEADIIIDYGLVQFERWRQKVASQPEIIDFRSRVRSVCDSELRGILEATMRSDEADRMLDELSHRISQKLSHDVTRVLAHDLTADDDDVPSVIVVPDPKK